MIELGLSVEEAAAGSQQTFIVNLDWPLTKRVGPDSTVRERYLRVKPGQDRRRRPVATGAAFHPVPYQQLTLLEMPRDLARAKSRGWLPQAPIRAMEACLEEALDEHARQHGWPDYRVAYTRRALRTLQAIQDTPGAMLCASHVAQLRVIGLPVESTISVALRAGLMVDDRGENNRQDWLDGITAGLPDQVRHELDQWWHIMIDGSRKPPRRRPRDLETAQTYLRYAMPALSTWAEQGVASLREVTSDGVRQVLPASGNPRSTMGLGLRSIFTVLKGTKTIFLNPIARIPTGRPETTQPLPVDTDQIREALDSTDRLIAAVGALAAFHALRTGDILRLHLADLADGRLELGDRRIPLAAPVLSRLREWLDWRDERWPKTSNPHLFINQYTALRATPMHRTTLRRRMPINIQDLREDRLLAEGIETNGDVRQMGALFGIDVQTALRYAPPPEPDEPAAAPGHR